MTNARFASFHGLSVARMPRDHARSLRKSARSSRAASAPSRHCGGLPSAARRRDVPLRLRFASRSSPPALHFPRSPTADRSWIKPHLPPANSIAGCFGLVCANPSSPPPARHKQAILPRRPELPQQWLRPNRVSSTHFWRRRENPPA